MSKDSKKKSLRREFKAIRDSLDENVRKRAAASISRKLLEMDEFQKAKAVYMYLSFGSEVDTWNILKAAQEDGKTVYAPICLDGGLLRWRRVPLMGSDSEANGKFFTRNEYGIFEPIECESSFGVISDAMCSNVTESVSGSQSHTSCLIKETSIAVVPGLVFDNEGYRIGYGGGYYDRFLKSYEGTSIGICYRPQIVDSLDEAGAIDQFDVPVDFVICD